MNILPRLVTSPNKMSLLFPFGCKKIILCQECTFKPQTHASSHREVINRILSEDQGNEENNSMQFQ